VAEGHLNKVTGPMLGITERMVEVHRSKAYEKLGVDTPAELATTIADMKGCGIVAAP
jgi:DNA-binding NarL/FixJ family response regulator